MSRIEDFRFNKSTYDRPSQKHVCGRSIVGSSCQMGPDINGECQSQSECIPNKKGDRWFCSRLQNNGGPCENGPSPQGVCDRKIPKCVPTPSNRHRRNKIVRWSALLSIVFLILFIFFPMMPELVLPGALSSNHQFLDGECNSCHQTDVSDPIKWIQRVSFRLHSNDNNVKCKKCHQFGVENNRRAHTAEPKLLDIKNLAKAGSNYSCVFCHREHQGRQFSLTQISDRQCQGCHKKAFVNFEGAHADFDNYPFKRRTPLIFDHNGHLNDYFSKDAKQGWLTTDCSRCHTIDRNGFSQKTNKFAQICVDCHEAEVTAKRLEVKTIPLLQLPAIDTSALKNAKLNIGQWPTALDLEKTEDAEQEISAALLLLLATNTELEPLLKQLSLGDIELIDLSDQPEEVLQQVALLAWSIKALMYKTEIYGEEWFYDNISLQYIEDRALIDVKQFTKIIPYRMINNARKEWFPKIKKEIKKKKYRKYAYLFTEVGFTPITDVVKNGVSGNWILDEYSIAYQPMGHADLTMVRMLNLALHASNVNDAEKAYYEKLTKKKGPGQCVKCHSLEVSNGKKVVNWTPKSFDAKIASLTAFSHRAHPNARIDKGCNSCHTINKKSTYLKTYKKMDPYDSDSNFTAILKSNCSGCHQENKSGESCVLCHQYHITKSTRE